MLSPIDIANAAHKVCEEELIPKGISPPHEVLNHIETSRWYADAINLLELEVTGEEVIESIFNVTGWDRNSAWPGHPEPEKVINDLLARKKVSPDNM